MSNLNETYYPWHNSSWAYFTQARTKNHLPHALLLVGEAGIGKHVLAERIARSLLCMHPTTDYQACGNCQSCKTYESGANPDYTNIQLLEDKQQISVDQIRKLGEFLNYSRSFNTHRVVIINPIERMNTNAANSLLKSLEEPANHSVIILIASHLGKILPTIKSRCQLVTVKSPNHEQSLTWLKTHYPELNQAELRLDMTASKPLKALAVSEEDISSRLDFLEDLKAIVEESIPVVATAKKWEKNDVESLLNWQIAWSQQLIKQAECSDYFENLAINQDQHFYKTQQALFASIKQHKEWHLYQQLIKQKQYIHTSVNTLMFIESMLLLWLEAGK